MPSTPPVRVFVFLPIIALVLVAALLLVTRPSPASANPLTGVTMISAGEDHTCALTTAGGAACWGLNYNGQLGDSQACGYFCFTPVNVTDLTSGVAAVTSGYGQTCAVTTAGGAKCWGYNGAGTLGNGTVTDSYAPVDVSGLSSGVATVSAGRRHTCALTTAGGVKCWGENEFGQLGDGTNSGSELCNYHFPCNTVPVDVSTLTSGVAALSAGELHTCALTTAGGVRCWGSNLYGQLGNGTVTDSSTPVDVYGLTSGVVGIFAGGNHTCALTTVGGIKCWGDNAYGELGIGTSSGPPWCYRDACRVTPTDVSGLTSGVVAVSAGYYHTCALSATGGATCWGDNEYGQLGNGTTTTTGCFCSATPVDVSGLTSGVAAISSGTLHNCALTDAGAVECWGQNVYGELGDGTNLGRSAPVDVVAVIKSTPTPTHTASPTAKSSPTGMPTSTPTETATPAQSATPMPSATPTLIPAPVGGASLDPASPRSSREGTTSRWHAASSLAAIAVLGACIAGGISVARLRRYRS